MLRRSLLRVLSARLIWSIVKIAEGEAPERKYCCSQVSFGVSCAEMILAKTMTQQRRKNEEEFILISFFNRNRNIFKFDDQ